MATKPEHPEQNKNKIDDYLLISLVANGKLSQIWEVMHEQTNQKLAMKLLLPEAMDDADEKELLKHEAKVAQSLEHPILIRCHGVVMRKTECYILLDLFKAMNVKQFIKADLRGVHMRFRKLVEDVCNGLGHMHDKGWVHKDLKPDNILLSRSGEVRIIDFSLAVKKATGLSKLFNSKSGVIRGTRSYLAPETIKKEPSTPATDIYSLGITFYECLAGTLPFKSDNPQDLLKKHLATDAAPPSFYNPNITPEMDKIILKMMAKKPSARYQSCGELAAEFRNVQSFKEEVTDTPVVGAAEAANQDELQQLFISRLDSRNDAKLKSMIESNPALQAQYEADKKRREEIKINRQKAIDALVKKEEAKKRGAKPAPIVAVAPVVAPTPVQNVPVAAPPMPGMMHPGMMPGYPMPQMMPQYGMPPQGMPMYPGMPGMPPMGMPGYPQQMPNPMGYPPGTMPPQMMPPGYPPNPPMARPAVPPVPAPPPPRAAVNQPQKPQPPVQAKPEEKLDFMTDLPEVI